MKQLSKSEFDTLRDAILCYKMLLRTAQHGKVEIKCSNNLCDVQIDENGYESNIIDIICYDGFAHEIMRIKRNTLIKNCNNLQQIVEQKMYKLGYFEPPDDYEFKRTNDDD